MVGCVWAVWRHLLQVEAVGDVVGGEEGGDQVGDGSSFSTVRPELEGVEPSLPEDISDYNLSSNRIKQHTKGHIESCKELCVVARSA